jgi:hypothetical protein
MVKLTPTTIGIALVGVAAVAAVAALPAARQALRPALKSGVKGLAAASLAIRRQFAELGEAWDDLLAEVGMELAAEQAAKANGSAEGVEPPPAEQPRKRRARKAA